MDGSMKDFSGTLAISADGIVTCSSGCDPNFLGAVDSDERVMVVTDTSNSGTLLHVFTKRGASYAQGDLAGKWRFSSLIAHQDHPGGWHRGTLTIDANGNASGTLAKSDGSVQNIAETLVLSGAGVVSCTSGCNAAFHGNLDSAKTVIVSTE